MPQLRAAGALFPLDEHFARAVGRIGGEDRLEVLLAVALLSRQVRNGHVCLDVRRFAAGQLVDERDEPVAGVSLPRPDRWLEMLGHSPLVGGDGQVTPLVLDGAGRLYLRRYWEHQKRLGEALRARAAVVEEGLDAAALKSDLDRLFRVPGGGQGSDAVDGSRIAGLVAVRRRLGVISGGPGTGKTFTVAKILALLVEQGLRLRGRVPRVALLAPTGKAAARLGEAIKKAKPGLACAAAVKDAIPEEAATIHRCLGAIPGSATRFRRHAGNPLLADAVLVDEASMVDLALMDRLLDAVPPSARVILLGDKDQLASVEAGAVLGDICNTGAPRSYSRRFVEDVAALSGEHLPLPPAAAPETGIWDCIVQLTRSYRYGSAGGIGKLAAAINAGDGAGALSVLRDAEDADVSLVEPAAGSGPTPLLRRSAFAGFAAYLRETDLLARMQPLDRFRVLCAHRAGRWGAAAVNRQIEAALGAAGLLALDSGPNYTGRPILITRNDYELELFNGDVGLLAADAEGRGNQEDGVRVRAFFVAPDGKCRAISPARLPPHETVFAMTVHKSQGSEFDEVAVLLPDRVTPVLTRELLYTAVTRGRRQVTIHGTGEVVREAVGRPTERASGLRDMLWPER